MSDTSLSFWEEEFHQMACQQVGREFPWLVTAVEGAAHWDDNHPWQVVLDGMRKQAKQPQGKDHKQCSALVSAFGPHLESLAIKTTALSGNKNPFLFKLFLVIVFITIKSKLRQKFYLLFQNEIGKDRSDDPYLTN